MGGGTPWRSCPARCVTFAASAPPRPLALPASCYSPLSLFSRAVCVALQRYWGTAVGKGARSARTEIQKLKLTEKTCDEALPLLAKM